MFEDIFLRKKAVLEKLDAYGFRKIRNCRKYDMDVLNGEFRLEITIGKNSVPDTKLTEIATGEEYVLYKTDAAGTFVGEVRTAVANILQNIADCCYETTVLKAEQFIALIAYVREKFGMAQNGLERIFPKNKLNKL